MSNLIKTRLYGLSAIDDRQKNLQQIESEWQIADAEVEELISAYDEMARIDQQIILVKKQKDTLKNRPTLSAQKTIRNFRKKLGRSLTLLVPLIPTKKNINECRLKSQRL